MCNKVETRLHHIFKGKFDYGNLKDFGSFANQDDIHEQGIRHSNINLLNSVGEKVTPMYKSYEENKINIGDKVKLIEQHADAQVNYTGYVRTFLEGVPGVYVSATRRGGSLGGILEGYCSKMGHYIPKRKLRKIN